MIRKHIISFMLLLLGGNFLYSQDPQFSQYYANPVYLNPAFAGTSLCPRLILNYRNQWPSITGSFVTYNASYDQHVDRLSGGVGLMFTSDKAGEGVLNTDMISGVYSYRLQINRRFSIKAGLQASYFQKKLDWGKLTFGDQIDSKYGFVYTTQEKKPEVQRGTADFSAGILAFGEDVYGGVAIHHLTQPNIGFTTPHKLPMKITAHVGAIFDLEYRRRRRKVTDPTISPNVLFMKQGEFQQINYGLYINKYPMVGGLWFRQGFDNPDAFIALVGVQTGIVKIGYSYDLTVSKLTNASGGAHEVSFTVQFGCKPKKKRIRAINCPSF